jgi:hypothetical protein
MQIQVKELGALITNCTCLIEDAQKLFDVYWLMGKQNAQVPPKWPGGLVLPKMILKCVCLEYLWTQYNALSPMKITINDVPQRVYLSVSKFCRMLF